MYCLYIDENTANQSQQLFTDNYTGLQSGCYANLVKKYQVNEWFIYVPDEYIPIFNFQPAIDLAYQTVASLDSSWQTWPDMP